LNYRRLHRQHRLGPRRLFATAHAIQFNEIEESKVVHVLCRAADRLRVSGGDGSAQPFRPAHVVFGAHQWATQLFGHPVGMNKPVSLFFLKEKCLDAKRDQLLLVRGSRCSEQQNAASRSTFCRNPIDTLSTDGYGAAQGAARRFAFGFSRVHHPSGARAHAPSARTASGQSLRQGHVGDRRAVWLPFIRTAVVLILDRALRDIDRRAVVVGVGRQLHPVAAHLELDEDGVERFRRASSKIRPVYDLAGLWIERSKFLNRFIAERCVCTNASSTSRESFFTTLMLTIASNLGAIIINAQRI
jgi:hypothetical protein